MSITTIRFKPTKSGFAVVTTQQTFQHFSAGVQTYQVFPNQSTQLIDEQVFGTEQGAIAVFDTIPSITE